VTRCVAAGVLVAEAAPVFVPVRVTADPPPPVPGANAAPAASSAPGKTKCSTGDGRIEIALPDGTLIRVGEEIGSAALRRVVAALRGA
jgi:transposase